MAIDGLDSYSLKIAAKLVAVPIHHLVSLSIMQQKFPTLWKKAKVLPLHKKGDVLERKNYRPVSILSPVSKVLEKAIYDQLYSYFSKNKIFHSNVMGYRKNRSTETAILQMYDRWVRGAGQGNISGIVFLDLSAAFDLVDSKILIEKLKIYGLKEDFISWISCYLSERKQAVWIDHTLSDWLDVSVGVPQGSILGPLLFIIFANDLPYLLSSNLDQYADDSTLSSVKSSVPEINLELNDDCQVVSTWMLKNHLCLNADKSGLMVAGTSQKMHHTCRTENVSVFMDGLQLHESEDKNEKILGVHFQSNLKWTRQCQEVQLRLKCRLVGLRKIQNVLPLDKRKIVAQSIFQSVLSYCISVWGGTAKRDIESLQVIQNRAAQFVLNVCVWRVNRNQMYKQLQWLTEHQLFVFNRILAVYRIRRSGEPEYLAALLSKDNIRGNIIVPHTGLSLLKRSFAFNGAELWNRVPHDLRQIGCQQKFRRLLREWILANIKMFL